MPLIVWFVVTAVIVIGLFGMAIAVHNERHRPEPPERGSFESWAVDTDEWDWSTDDDDQEDHPWI